MAQSVRSAESGADRSLPTLEKLIGWTGATPLPLPESQGAPT
ncbi:hypothetical protein [Nocardia panacis]|nr:hypothetical protein [Nocardia panacis]